MTVSRLSITTRLLMNHRIHNHVSVGVAYWILNFWGTTIWNEYRKILRHKIVSFLKLVLQPLINIYIDRINSLTMQAVSILLSLYDCRVRCSYRWCGWVISGLVNTSSRQEEKPLTWQQFRKITQLNNRFLLECLLLSTIMYTESMKTLFLNTNRPLEEPKHCIYLSCSTVLISIYF